DFVLRQVGRVERTDDTELPCRLAAWPVVAAVVGIAAVGDRPDATVARDRREMRIELVLAVIAAVAGVGAVLRARHLVGMDDFVPEAELAGQPEGHLTVALGVAGAVGGDTEGTGTERP